MALDRLVFAPSLVNEGVQLAAESAVAAPDVLSVSEIGVDEAGDSLHNLASLLRRAADTERRWWLGSVRLFCDAIFNNSQS
ncbi:hypothetical protein, partial [Paraburkholderia solisilvae]|uniref:hypothetical protein n=1 Tax=Paraburkholderia solisilvae TaxID=624376 RepID=UPI001C2ECA5A